ncbi:MAG: Matrixin family metalloprotease [Acidobacteriota bacterium]|nr:Matrixin family metalloprotease [Acidobacteriota bacterium]
MPTRSRLSPFRALLLALALGAITAAEATTVKLVNDFRLVDQARIVLVARVTGTIPAAELDRPVTDYLMTVERVLKGSVGESSILVRVPGGRAANGMELKIWGAPTFVEGERALLFLGRHDDGTYRILHLMLGAFREALMAGHAVAYRDLSEVDVLDEVEALASETRKVRDFDLFADWIADRADSRLQVPNYYRFLPGNSQNSLLPMFTLLGEGGRDSRWFEFDSGGQVGWRIDPDPFAGFSGSTADGFRNALAAWNAESHTPIRLVMNGTSGLTAGFTTFDRQNVLLFEDPNGDIEGDFSCSTGGTLAIGGPWYDPDVTGRFNGETYIRIQGADIVLNDGIGCLFERSVNPAKAFEELVGHETGHTLGLGHASENGGETNQTLRDALMYFRIHNDGRGARLTSDDIAGLRTIYDQTFSGGGGGGTAGCPANTLCLVNKRFQVSAVWNNQFDGSSGTAGATPNTDLAGFLYFSDPNNIELIVKVLDFGDRVAFFYGQLTNLRFTISVLDTRSGVTKTYGNTPGECGALDNNLAASSATFETVPIAGHGNLVAMAACQSTANAVCLLGGRFRLELDWRNQFDSSSGRGAGKKLSDLTAAFSFTDPANLEVLVKTLDFGDRVLVLYGTLSNLEYTLRITETTSGRVKTYHNAANNYCGGLDNNAF